MSKIAGFAAFACLFATVVTGSVVVSANAKIEVDTAPDPMTLSVHQRGVPAMIKNRPLLAVKLDQGLIVPEMEGASEMVAQTELSVHERGVPALIKNRPLLAVKMQGAFEREANARLQSQVAAAKGDRLSN